MTQAGDVQIGQTIEVDGQLQTIRGIAVCNGANGQGLAMIGGPGFRTACAIKLQLSDGTELIVHPHQPVSTIAKH